MEEGNSLYDKAIQQTADNKLLIESGFKFFDILVNLYDCGSDKTVNELKVIQQKVEDFLLKC